MSATGWTPVDNSASSDWTPVQGQSQQSQTPTAPQPSTASQVATGAADTGKGFLEGAVQPVSDMIASIPGIGKHIISPDALQAERASFAPKSTAEKVGQVGGNAGETALEFILGDEALKGLSIAEKVGLAGKIAKMGTESPYLAKLLDYGATASRQGLIGTGQGLAHGDTATQAVAQGATTAAVAPIAEEALSGFKTTRGVLNQIIQGKNVSQDAAQAAMRELAEGPGNTAYRARPVGEQGVSASSKMPQATMSEPEANTYKSSLANMSGKPQEVVPIDLDQQPGNFKKYPGPNGADWVKFDKDIGESEVGQGPLQSNPSLRQSLGGRIDRGESAYKSLYRQVDAASGTNLKDLSEQLDNYQYKMRQAGTPEAEDAWQGKVDELTTQITAAKQKAQQAGVDPSVLDKADSIYKKVNAMKDAEKKLFTDPNVISGDQALGKAESLDTDKAITRLQQLRNNTRWGAPRADQAFGKESVDNALTKLYAAQTSGEKAVAMRKVAGWLGIPAGVALAGEAAKTIVGSKP